VIMVTGVKEKSMVDKAKEAGCQFYLNKPFSLKDVEECVNHCLAESKGKDASN